MLLCTKVESIGCFTGDNAQVQNINHENQNPDRINGSNFLKGDVETLYQICANYSIARWATK